MTQEENKVFNDDSNFIIDLKNYKNQMKRNKKMKDILSKLLYSKTTKLRNENSATYRMINNWIELGLLNDTRTNKKGWHKFDVIDSIWLDIVNKLRNFGVPSSIILKVKEKYYKDNSKIEVYIIKAMLGENVRCIITSNGNFKFADKIDISSINNSSIDEYYTISLSKIVTKIIGINIIDDKLISIPLGMKEYGIFETIALSNNGDEIILKLKNNKIQKYKKVENMNTIQIKNFKQLTLKELSNEYKNSKVIIYINEVGICGMEVQKSA